MQLDSIPNNLFNFKNIEVLHLNDNNISVISPNIRKLTELRVLNLRNNKLEMLPDEIFDLKKLEFLMVAGNRFDSKYIEKVKKRLPKDCVFFYELVL